MKKMKIFTPIISFLVALAAARLVNTQYAFISYMLMGALVGFIGTILLISYREKRGIFSKKV